MVEVTDPPSITIRPTLAAAASAPTLMGSTIGTPSFMAPEQLQSGRFASAAAILKESVTRLQNEPALQEIRTRVFERE